MIMFLSHIGNNFPQFINSFLHVRKKFVILLIALTTLSFVFHNIKYKAIIYNSRKKLKKIKINSQNNKSQKINKLQKREIFPIFKTV